MSEPFEVSVSEAVWEDLRARLSRTRWPDGALASHGDTNAPPRPGAWDLGVDFGYLRGLCAYWTEEYDPGRLPSLLNRFSNYRRDGLHFIRVHPAQPPSRAAAGRAPALEADTKLPLMLLHGWPGGPIEYLEVIPRLAEAGHEVVVPSMPGYAWSDDPGAPLNVAAVAARFGDLAEQGLGWERYGVVGGDWGAPIAARMAFDSPQRVAALYVFTPGTLPPSAQLADPPLSGAEQAFIEEGMRWRRREGHHMLLQSTVPDIVAVGLNDSPAGLAAYLLEKYRRWSDCGGEVERRFSRDQLCDYLTMYWATATIASSMRLYWGERAARWRPAEGEAIDVPAAAGVFPAEIINPPREWSERLLVDLRRWTEMPRGGHFAAHEEPGLLADDVLAFVGGL